MSTAPEINPQSEEIAVEQIILPQPETDNQNAAPFEKADSDPMQPQAIEYPKEDEDEEAEEAEQPTESPKMVKPDRGMIGDVVEFIDEFKATLCQAIAQDDKPDKYRQTKEKRDRFATALDTYLGNIDYKISPNTSFFVICLMFFCPALFIAGRERMKKNKAKRQAAIPPNEPNNPAPTTQSSSPEQPPNSNPFATSPEYQAKRKKFELHSNGSYKFDAAGEYLKVENAKETPSEMVKYFILQNFNNAKIKEIMGYE